MKMEADTQDGIDYLRMMVGKPADGSLLFSRFETQ
jgi:hypothetical protein